MIYSSWQKPVGAMAGFYGKESPNLVRIKDWLLSQWGGMNLGIAAIRDTRSGSGVSSHAYGAALDWRYINPGPGRAVLVNEILPKLLDAHEELGIQLIVDYVGSRSWKVNRSPNGDPNDDWTLLRADRYGMGKSWAGWLHIETTAASWGDSRSVVDRFPQEVVDAPFAPEFGLFGLWPLNPNKPALRAGATGDAVRYLQGALRKAGHGLPCDGMYGRITEDHVKWFQTVMQLTVDGRVGPQTWAAIDRVAA